MSQLKSHATTNGFGISNLNKEMKEPFLANAEAHNASYLTTKGMFHRKKVENDGEDLSDDN